MQNLSEEFYQLLFETATEGIIICDREGSIKIINEATEKIFGYKKVELVNKKIEILIPSSLRNKHQEHRKSYLSSPKKRRMGEGRDLLGLTKFGKEVPIEISLNHISHNNEKYVMALVTDVTNRKANEKIIQQLNSELREKVDQRTKKLKESEKLYSLISRNFPNGTINVFNKNLEYIFAEGQELFKLGISSEQLVGKKYLERLPNKIAQEIKPKLKDVFNGNENSFDLETDNQIYHIKAVPLVFGVDKCVEQILVVEQNVTNERMAEKKIKDTLKKEKELGELKSRFVSMASHEFRTPLSTVLSSASLIDKYQEKGNSEKIKRHIGKIKNSVKNLTHILNDILSLTKLEEGHVEVNFSDFNLKSSTLTIIENISGLLKDKQKVILDYHGDEQCYHDEKIINLILTNLLSNALKYSHDTVKLILKKDKTKLSGTIIDKGIGIPEEDQKKLFQRFYRAQNSTNIQGTGLGLNIVKNYLDILGGEIQLKSKVDEGTTVNFYIPLIN